MPGLALIAALGLALPPRSATPLVLARAGLDATQLRQITSVLLAAFGMVP